MWRLEELKIFIICSIDDLKIWWFKEDLRIWWFEDLVIWRFLESEDLRISGCGNLKIWELKVLVICGFGDLIIWKF